MTTYTGVPQMAQFAVTGGGSVGDRTTIVDRSLLVFFSDPVGPLLGFVAALPRGGHSVGLLIPAMSLEGRLPRTLGRAVLLIPPAALADPHDARATTAAELDGGAGVGEIVGTGLHEHILHQNSCPI